jgi:hypothetical protein
MGQRGGPPYEIIVVCEGDGMERRHAETAEEKEWVVRELERKFRNCLINVVPKG